MLWAGRRPANPSLRGLQSAPLLSLLRAVAGPVLPGVPGAGVNGAELRRRILDPCGCGHCFGDHAAWPPHRCVTFTDPDCPCEGFVEPAADGSSQERPAATVAAPPTRGEVPGGAATCMFCDGTRVVEYEDPIIGGLVLANCPTCEGTP